MSIHVPLHQIGRNAPMGSGARFGHSRMARWWAVLRRTMISFIRCARLPSSSSLAACVLVCLWQQGAGAAERQGPADEGESIIWSVFVHARCANCHAAGEGPTQGEDMRPHSMAVRRGEKGSGEPGLACSACHFPTRHPLSAGPPTAAVWQMPGSETPMIFARKTWPELCAQLKDPELTGKATFAEAIEHMLDDPLVAWSFEPGPGREPPPVTKREFFAELAKWARAGAPCPP